MIENTYVDGVCREEASEMSFTDLNANYEFDEGIDEFISNAVSREDVEDDVCCRRAPKGDLELLAACPKRAERANGKHVYYEAREECRFEGTNNVEFFDSTNASVQTIAEEIDEERDQSECCDAKRNGSPGENLDNACVTFA